jgi:NAD(P)-dependent dehydrogenase (short-subunit alcohol dehydrogenase family)
MSATTPASSAWPALPSGVRPVHILVNNAGCNVRKPALDVTWDDWNLILDTNLRGSFFVAQQIARSA